MSAGDVIEPPTAVQPVEPELEVPVPTEAPAEPRPSPDFVPISFDEPAEDEREPLPVSGEAPAPSAEEKGPSCKGSSARKPLQRSQQPVLRHLRDLDGPPDPQLVDGPRPALGVMVVDDGSSYVLESDYVIGRDPEQADDVSHGRRPSPPPARREEGHLARACPHPARRMERHRGRRRVGQGTFVAQPGDQSWTW